jgi:hypothetical protein
MKATLPFSSFHSRSRRMTETLPLGGMSRPPISRISGTPFLTQAQRFCGRLAGPLVEQHAHRLAQRGLPASARAFPRNRSSAASSSVSRSIGRMTI